MGKSGEGGGGRRKEIYTYEAPWNVFALAWSYRLEPHLAHRLAIGSFIEDYNNKVQIIQRTDRSFTKVAEVDHPYPCTKVLWNPDKSQGSRDLFATAGDFLRFWNIAEDRPSDVAMLAQLNNAKNTEYCSPLTSLDWNELDPNTIGTSSIDTTCTIWDVPTTTPTMQVIAHDKVVYDMSFSSNMNIFASVGADGSVRTFDLRNLEHSTIVYETADLAPLVRIMWNQQDPNYLATIHVDSSSTIILDIRLPTAPVATLRGHQAAVNAIAWAPHSSCHICSAADDSQALIWDLSAIPKPIEGPVLAYSAEAEINNIHWSIAHPEMIGIAFEKKVQALRV